MHCKISNLADCSLFELAMFGCTMLMVYMGFTIIFEIQRDVRKKRDEKKRQPPG